MLGHMVQVFRKIISNTNKQFKLVLYCNYRPFHFEIKKLIKISYYFVCMFSDSSWLHTTSPGRRSRLLYIFFFQKLLLSPFSYSIAQENLPPVMISSKNPAWLCLHPKSKYLLKGKGKCRHFHWLSWASQHCQLFLNSMLLLKGYL